MSLFSKILGRKTFEEERARALQLFEEGELGLAKLAFERALDRGADRPAEARAEVEAKIVECCDGIARARTGEAERLLQQGELELALAELEAAAETAVSTELKTHIEERAEAAVRKDARSQAERVVEQSEEERFESLSGNWEEDQYAELAADAEVQRALLAAQDGETAAALELLERRLAAAEAPRYLHYEVGRLRLIEGDKAGGQQALGSFLSSMGEGEGGEARLSAHMELAQLHQEAGEFEQAVAQYEAAVEALPDDSRPYLAMAAFLRREGHAAEAAEILHSAAAIDARERPHWTIAEQLGLAYAELGRDAQAIELLEDAVAQLATRGEVVLPVEGTGRLCQLHEKAGNLTRAVDLWSLLARGGDAGTRFGYQLEAARLMLELGLTRDARQMLQRASELAPEEPAARERLEALRSRLQD